MKCSISGARSLRRPTGQAMKNLPVILAFDGHAPDALLGEGPIGEPPGVRHDDDPPFPRFGSSEQAAGLLARAVDRSLIQVVHHPRARFRWMRRIDPQQVAAVIGPAQATDDRRLPW